METAHGTAGKGGNEWIEARLRLFTYSLGENKKNRGAYENITNYIFTSCVRKKLTNK